MYLIKQRIIKVIFFKINPVKFISKLMIFLIIIINNNNSLVCIFYIFQKFWLICQELMLNNKLLKNN